jgi:tripartite-type tricarboxylate transporter receptor subunit TctC
MHSGARKAVIAALCALMVNSVCAQGFPAKPVRLITPYPPGGGADSAARLIAQALSETLGQQFIVDNRAGASGQIGTDAAARAPADGYTILLGSVGPNAILPASGAKVPYDALKDFAPISLVAISEYGLAVHPSLPVKTVKDLIALARPRPDQISFGSTGVAGGPHLAGELMNSLTGIRMLHVPYKGGGPVMAALLGGEVSVSFSTLPTVMPHRENGRLRLVAVTGPRRSASVPDVPAISEVIQGYEVTQWYGLLAPAGTDASIVGTLNAGTAKAVAMDRVVKSFQAAGATATSNTPDAFRQLIQTEIEKWSKVFRQGKISLN